MVLRTLDEALTLCQLPNDNLVLHDELPSTLHGDLGPLWILSRQMPAERSSNGRLGDELQPALLLDPFHC